MSSKKIKKSIESVEVKEFIRFLKASEQFLSSISTENKNLVLFLQKINNILKPLENVNGETFLEGLKNSLKLTVKFGDIENIPLDDLKNLLYEEELTKKELLYIATTRLEIPTGMMQRMKKEAIKSTILSTVQNIQKLDAIQKKASE